MRRRAVAELRRGRTIASHVSLGGVVGMLLASCVGDPDVSVAAGSPGGHPTLFVPLCPDETVQAVYLVDSTAQDGQGPTIWRLDATDPTPSQDRTNSAFAIGEVPDGYVETEELEPGATDRRLTAWALTSSGIELIGAVDFGRVAEDELQLDLKPISADALLKSRSC